MAYFGPNAKLLGNIKLEIWHFETPIVDIQAYLTNVFVLTAVDLVSLVITGIVLWHYCKINVKEILRHLQKKYWHFFAIAEGYLIMEVSTEQINFPK